MTRNLVSNGRKLVFFITVYQLFTAIVITTLIAVFFAQDKALSYGLGCITAMIPALVMGLFTFKYAGGNKNKLVLKSFNAGNKIKFLLTLVLIGVSLKQPFLVFEWYLIGLALTMVFQWIAIARYQKNQ